MDPGYLEQLIENNNLPYEIAYLGTALWHAKVIAGDPGLYYFAHPAPSQYSNLQMNRIFFEPWTSACAQGTQITSPLGSIHCDFPAHFGRILTSEPFARREPNAFSFLRAVTVNDEDIQTMVDASVAQGFAVSVSDWVQTHQSQIELWTSQCENYVHGTQQCFVSAEDHRENLLKELRGKKLSVMVRTAALVCLEITKSSRFAGKKGTWQFGSPFCASCPQ